MLNMRLFTIISLIVGFFSLFAGDHLGRGGRGGAHGGDPDQ